MAKPEIDVLFFVPVFKDRDQPMTGGQVCARKVVDGLVERGVKVEVLTLEGLETGGLWGTARAIYRRLKTYNGKAAIMIYDTWLYKYLWPIMGFVKAACDFKIVPYSLHCHWSDFRSVKSQSLHRLLTYAAVGPSHYNIGSSDAVLAHNLGWMYKKDASKVVFPGCDFKHMEIKQADCEGLPLQVISVGSFQPRKQYHNLVEAMGILAQKEPDIFAHINLCLVGNQSYDLAYVQGLKDRASALGVIDHLILKDWPSREELSTHFSSSQLFALASQNEAFGMVALEAMYHGLPVLLGDFMTAGELQGPNLDCGYIVNRYRPEEFADAMITHWQVKDKAAVGKRSRQRALDITDSWEEMVGKFHLALGEIK